jgi:hypothetical protein
LAHLLARAVIKGHDRGVVFEGLGVLLGFECLVFLVQLATHRNGAGIKAAARAAAALTMTPW